MKTETSTASKSLLQSSISWIFTGIFGFLSFGALFDGAILSFVFYTIGVLILIPLLSAFRNEHLSFLSNWIANGILLIFLFLVAFYHEPNNETPNPIVKADVVNIKEYPYQEYLDNSNSKIEALTPEKRRNRDKLINELVENPIYIELVDSDYTTTEYLPILHYISIGISFSTNEGFSMFAEMEDRLKNSRQGKAKLRFASIVTALAGNTHNGVPVEVVDLFERFKSRYGIYGSAGTVKGIRAESTEVVEYDFDLSPFFGMLQPRNEYFLNSIYEAKKKTYSDWPDEEKSIFPFLSSKEMYFLHLKKVYPNSPYLLKVDFELSAVQLYQAYNENEVAADRKYNGKLLAVTGVVGEITKDFLDDGHVSFNVGIMQSVDCNFGKELEKIEQLKRGDKVIIIGRCKGYLMKQVILDNCKVWE